MLYSWIAISESGFARKCRAKAELRSRHMEKRAAITWSSNFNSRNSKAHAAHGNRQHNVGPTSQQQREPESEAEEPKTGPRQLKRQHDSEGEAMTSRNAQPQFGNRRLAEAISLKSPTIQKKAANGSVNVSAPARGCVTIKAPTRTPNTPPMRWRKKPDQWCTDNA